MKALKRKSISTAMVLFLGVGLCYAQNPAKQISDRGLEYAAEGKFTEAKEEFEEALKIDAFYEPARRSLKIIEDVIGQKITVETAFYLFRGAVYHNRGQLIKAIAEYNKAIEINPKYAPVFNNRGFAHIGKGDYDQAIFDCNKALDVNPREAMAYNIRAVAYFFKREFDKSWDDVYKAQNLGYPVRPEFLKSLREASGRER